MNEDEDKNDKLFEEEETDVNSIEIDKPSDSNVEFNLRLLNVIEALPSLSKTCMKECAYLFTLVI